MNHELNELSRLLDDPARLQGLTAEQQLARQALPDNASECPHIAPCVGFLSAGLLGAHVGGRA